MIPVIPLSKIDAWKGVELCLGWLREQKLLAADLYRQGIIDYCNRLGLGEGLELYWSEMAKELVSSGEVCGDRGRYIDQPDFYRSAYLDALCEGKEPVDGEFYLVHEGMKRYIEDVEASDRVRFQALLKTIQVEKRQEFRHLNIENVDLESDLFLEDILKVQLYEYGFQIRERKRNVSVYMRSVGGISSEIHLPAICYADAAGAVPIGFVIRRNVKGAADIKFHGGIPLVGLFAYSLSTYVKGDGSRNNPAIIVPSPEAYVVNSYALVGVFDILVRSLA